jgi:hypothetical protein
MPIKKKPVSEKEKLQAKTIDQLKRYAKTVGANIVDPKTDKQKTKVQLINSIIMLQRLGKAKKQISAVVKKQTSKKTAAASRQTKMKGRDIVRDLNRKAAAPGKRTSASGRTYYERRANRSDVKGTLLGQKYSVDRQLVDEVIIFAENDSKMYDALMKNYLPNLQKKVLAGKYDPEQAIKLLEYYYTNYVRPYMKLPRNYGFDPKLNPDERKLFAKYFRDVLYNEYGLKEVEKAKKSFDKSVK